MPDRSNRKPWNESIFAFVVCLGFIYGTQVLASTYSRNVITQIERNFGKNSGFAGTISMAYNIGATLCLILLASGVVYRLKNRPKAIAAASCIAVLGQAICAMPKFLGNTYDPYLTTNKAVTVDKTTKLLTASTQYLCTNETLDLCERNIHDQKNEPWYGDMGLEICFLIGEFLMGFGVSVLMPLGYSYIDDYAPQEKTALYYSIIGASVTSGFFISSLFGALIASVWVEWPNRPPSDMTTDSPNWVGAWWIGYCIWTLLSFLAMLPMLKFPVSMAKESEEDVTESKKLLQSVNDGIPMWRKWGRVFSNLTVVCLISHYIIESYAYIGFFVPKYYEQHFGLKISDAQLIGSTVRVPFSIVGQILGGLLFSKVFKLNAQTAKLPCKVDKHTNEIS